MLVHGWPGSFYEFYKILPLLTENQDGLAFEVICPSIPGYGFSDAPRKQGRRWEINWHVSAWAADVYTCFPYLFRFWQSGHRKSFPDSDGAFRVLPVLSAGRRLGLPDHHQHGTDEASVRDSKTSAYTPQLTTAVEFTPPNCFLEGALWHLYIDCETVLALWLKDQKLEKIMMFCWEKNMTNTCSYSSKLTLNTKQCHKTFKLCQNWQWLSSCFTLSLFQVCERTALKHVEFNKGIQSADVPHDRSLSALPGGLKSGRCSPVVPFLREKCLGDPEGIRIPSHPGH